jgi:HNH endonuclease
MSELSETERQKLYQTIPFGRQSFYQSFREAGIRGARPLRNIPWILAADDGTPIFCLWRNYMRAVGNGVAAQMDVRKWTRASKGRLVQMQLSQSLGHRIRVVVVEDGEPGSNTARSTSFDPMMWQVEESRGDFLLTRTDEFAHRPGTRDEFTKRMLDLYDDAKAELNYRASRLLQTVRSDGGVAAAKTWLAKNSNPTEGFERLYREKRLDLSVEAIVLNPRWSGLFLPSELESARARLDEYGYFSPVRKEVRATEKLSPDEIDPHEEFPEGLKVRVEVNSYERDPKARSICIAHYGAKCIVCGFDFGKRFGKIGRGYIHVHHLDPVSMLGSGGKTNPVRDLRPVCPNCHAMLHKESPPMLIGKLRMIVANRVRPSKKSRRRKTGDG